MAAATQRRAGGRAGRRAAELACDPRCMTGVGPTSQRPAAAPRRRDGLGPAARPPPPSPAIERANRMNAANMLRSLLPLVVICLVIVAWTAFRQSGDVGVRTVDPSTTVQLAAARAGYPVSAPAGLDDGYRPTSARTDAGDAGEGDPVTLEIGYLTPSEEFAGFVVSDDPRAGSARRRPRRGGRGGDGRHRRRELDAVDDGAEETALSREADGRHGRRVRVGVGRRAGDRRGGGGAVLGLIPGCRYSAHEATKCALYHDLISAGCVACRRAAAHGTLPSHQSREHAHSSKEPRCHLVRPAPAATTGPRPPAVRVRAGW